MCVSNCIFLKHGGFSERSTTEFSEGTAVKSAWHTEAVVAPPRDVWDQDDEGTSGLPVIKETQRNKDYRGKNKGGRSDGRYNRNSHDASDRGYRHTGKEYRNSDRVSGDYRADNQETRDDTRGGGRRYKTGDNRNRTSVQDRGPRSDSDRHNRNRKESRDVRRDAKPNQSDNSGRCHAMIVCCLC